MFIQVMLNTLFFARKCSFGYVCQGGGEILFGVGGAEIFFFIFFIIKQHNLSESGTLGNKMSPLLHLLHSLVYYETLALEFITQDFFFFFHQALHDRRKTCNKSVESRNGDTTRDKYNNT